MTLDRREFLKSAAVGAFVAAHPRSAAELFSGFIPPRAQPASSPLVDRGFAQVSKIADGIYATIANPLKGFECASNGGVIAGRDAVLIVEGHMRPAGAALELEVARMVSKAGIRGALDTHFHLDHTFGNAAYAEQRIPILAHERVAPLMKERYADLKSVDKAPLLAPYEKRLAQAADENEKQHRQGDLADWKRMYSEIDAVTLAFPTEHLASAHLPTRIDLGGLTAVIEFHPGHSPTDLIIRVPERNVVFTGDLLFDRIYPVALDADMLAWRKVLDRFAAYDRATQFVPGHGAVCGLDNIRDQAALFDDLRAHAEKMIRSGATAEEAERRYTVPKRFEGYYVHWNFSIGAAMQHYFKVLAQS
jgi:glyoxylase-like metal-dependent hydrolase (beta-lactamase superfamily II)